MARRMSRPVVVLPAARLADQAERLALGNREVHPVDGLHLSHRAAQDTALNREVLGEAANLEQRATRNAHPFRSLAPYSVQRT